MAPSCPSGGRVAAPARSRRPRGQAAERATLDLRDAVPSHLDDHRPFPTLVITVCDRAHEEIGDHPDWLHWSIPDPVPTGTRAAFDATVDELRHRITDLVAATGAAA